MERQSGAIYENYGAVCGVEPSGARDHVDEVFAKGTTAAICGGNCWGGIVVGSCGLCGHLLFVEAAASRSPAVSKPGSGCGDRFGGREDRRSRAGLDILELPAKYTRHDGYLWIIRRGAGYCGDYRRYRSDVATGLFGAGLAVYAIRRGWSRESFGGRSDAFWPILMRMHLCRT